MAAVWAVVVWAMKDDAGRPIGPDPRDVVRAKITSLLGEAETKIGTAERRVRDFRVYTGELRKASLRVNYHLGRLGQSEADSQRDVEAIESELQYMKQQIEDGKPIKEAGIGRALSPAEIDARIEVRGVELGASRECLQVIALERTRFEKLYEQQLQELRTAPIHQKALDVKLTVLRTKYSLYQNRLDLLDETRIGLSAYEALYDEAKLAIDEASLELDCAVPEQSALQPLLIESSDNALAKSEDAVQRSKARIETFLNGGT